LYTNKNCPHFGAIFVAATVHKIKVENTFRKYFNSFKITRDFRDSHNLLGVYKLLAILL